ncbi:hypothetical protein UM764_05940 [Staphylococcus aureus]|nr:hypothetical protein UM764_05940 [Staphylococcus aureus]WRN72790.1 hypothetical protein UM582_01480 [Staphylococcus aureus]
MVVCHLSVLVQFSQLTTLSDAVENVGVDLVAIDKELLLDYQFVEKIKDGRENEIINYFDPERR